jgi:hypothetical protein
MQPIDWRRIEVPDDRVVELLRKKTPAERVMLGMECTQFVRERVLCHLRNTNPQWSDEQVHAEFTRRTRLCWNLQSS